MKKQGQSAGVKGKVLSGFFILLILALGAVFAIIKLAAQLSPPESGASDSVIKLTLVSNMLSELIEANGQARAYITTGEKRYLAKYRKLDKGILELADSLKYFSTLQPEQYRRMLVVDSLLRIKRGTMESFFKVTKSNDTLRSNPGLRLGSMDSTDKNFRPSDRQNTDHLTSRDGEEQSKQNFFKKIWDNITGKKPKRDTLPKQFPLTTGGDSIEAITAIQDTTIEMVKSQLLQMGEKERLDRQMTIERDLLLMRTDQVIMDEIRNVLLLFEKEEINRALEDAGHGRDVFRRLWNTAVVLAAVGLITMIFFVILIWKDLARSNFYRKQLESARHLAEKLLKVKELFLANMSHEIRTPITSIIGFTERLSSTALSKDQKNYLKYINSSSEHLLGLIDDLLDYSRIESGKFNLESIPFLPSELFVQAFETLRHKAERKGLEMIYNSDIKSGLGVQGDPLRIRQIVYNLLNNSLKFTEKGRINLDVTSTESDDVITLNFRVTDTGIGIPEEKQKEIFGEFTQVDVGITRKYGGSGLGLAICRKLVDLMKGDITLVSSPGKGTTISVNLKLPLFKGKVIEISAINPDVTINLTGFRILLAEDDETTRILLTELLSTAGANVDVAEDGKIALDLFMKHSSGYDLVMTDIQMPYISGPELAEKINFHARANEKAIPPIMGLTAHATREEIEIYRAQGIISFLIKPFKQYQLFESLGNILKIETMNNSGISDNGEPVQDKKIDLEAFLKFAGDDEAALVKILNSLADNLKNTGEQILLASESGDYQQVALLAHRMLPNIRNLGDRDEAAILQQLESLRRENNLDKETILNLARRAKKGMLELETAIRLKTVSY